MKKIVNSLFALAAALLFLSNSVALAQTSVTNWGKTSQGTAWPVLNNASTPAGNAGLGNGVKPTAWSTIRGGFNALEATTNQAFIASGQMELVGGGGGSAYTHLRYALTFIDSTTLKSQNTDSALWVSTGVRRHFGYEFCPRTGTGTVANGAWGVGTVGVVNNGNWNSTNSNGGKVISAAKQAPTNAEMVAGLYNWAISVQPLPNGNKEVRWYMVEQNNKYWFGGSAIDTSKVAAKFNGISFGFNNDQSATQVNFYAVKIDLGEPITVPEAPWEPQYVKQWGKTAQGTAWPILNDATYLDGDASIGNGAKPTAWATIRGGFEEPVSATATKAFIASGQMELVGGGGGSAYTHLRYALTFIDSTTLKSQNTDSALWVSTGVRRHFGYEFCPRTGTGTVANGAWGVGTVGVVNNGNWNSTNSNGGKVISAAKQAPTNAEMVAGLYNWAISVQPLANGNKEVRWYMVEQNNKYWFGGSAIDTSKVAAKFNGISFGFNNDQSATQVNFYAVKIDLGEPITVPEAPWEPQYVKQWGKTAQGTAWPILNDATYLDGDASIGNGAKPTAWATIRGGFEEPVSATATKAFIASGQMELVGGGGGSAYTHLRYALTFIDSTTLKSQNTDSALWVSTGVRRHFGYEFCPRTGTGTVANGAWGVGTVGVVNNGNWNSTNSNGGKVISAAKQAPTNAEMVAGLYNWAISVQPLANGNKEVRWYMVEQNNKYWFGGSAIDTSKVAAKFNGISFGFNNDQSATQVNFYAVKIDLGEPITVPEAPWEPQYVKQWGKTAQGTAWPILNDATYLDGDASIGNGAKPTAWATIRGGFEEPVSATATKAFIASGQMELVGGGGGSAYTHLRYALTFIDSTTLKSQNTDSALWVSTGVRRHFGYEFCPRTGTGTVANGAWGVGTVGVVNNGNWNSTNSNGGKVISAAKQAPTNAEMVAGLYNWAISVQPLANGNKEVRWYMVEQNNKYWFGGSAIDTSKVAAKFNGISFGFNNDQSATQVNFYAVKIDLGEPITVPEAPWEPQYVKQWGKTAQGTAWPILNDATYLDGDASIGNGAKPTAWATIRGGFEEPVSATATKAFIASGQMELVGGGGGSAYTHLRYALTFIDSTTLKSQNTDSALWVSTGVRRHFGYEFCPRTGTGTVANGAWGVGTVGVVNNGNWNSTNSNGGKVISAAKQAPTNAEMVAGLYNWAISVQPLANGNKEVRWYMVEQNNKYWFGGSAIDTSKVAAKFNGISFGFNNDQSATQVNFYAVKIDLGEPITVPEAPWEAYYVDTWGFYGGKIGGWKYTAEDFAGNATVSGSTPNTSMVAVRGAFADPLTPTTSKALIVTGQLEFVGGGFEAANSLRFGLFHSDSAGTVNRTPVDSTRWTGTEARNSGYLFVPTSGASAFANWPGNQQGSWGAVVDGVWHNTSGAQNYVLGRNRQLPANAVAGAGVYDFAISIAPQANGTADVRFKLTKTDNSYAIYGQMQDNHAPLATTKFNSMAFALSPNATTTGMKLIDLKIDLGAPISIPTSVAENPRTAVPAEFVLDQNYPNPFNPTTMIEFGLPKGSAVKLVVYDLAGRVVSELVTGTLNAGYHNINFDAAHLPSGVYYYKLEAEDFVGVKKLMLLK